VRFVEQCFLRFQTRLARLHQEVLDTGSTVLLDGTLPVEALVDQAVRAVQAAAPVVADATSTARRPSRAGREEVLR
jgi:hypothetical protein